MPELPEVDCARRQLEAWLRGRRVVKLQAVAGAPLWQTSPRDLRRLEGGTLRRVERVGKHLLLEFSGTGAGALGLYLHLGMSGKIVKRRRGDPAPRFSKATFVLARTQVHFCDARRFGRLCLLPLDRLRALPVIAAQGPDAWTALPSAAALAGRLSRVRREIKVALLDQRLLAGLGNIQASEALWRARLSPFASANTLTPEQVAALRQGIRATLGFTLARLGEVGDVADLRYLEEGGENWFKVYGREGLPCLRDGTPIRRTVQAARSTFDCPTCQGETTRPKGRAKLASPRRSG